MAYKCGYPINDLIRLNMDLPEFSVIVAADDDHAIGSRGNLPWYIEEDLRNFAKITKGGTVIMGRRTWESLPNAKRPLPERLNIIVSETLGTRTWEGMLQAAKSQTDLDLLWRSVPDLKDAL